MHTFDVTGQHLTERRVLHKVNDQDCLISIFLNKQEEIHKNCKYEITLNSLEPSITWIERNLFLLIKIPAYNLTCETRCRNYVGCLCEINYYFKVVVKKLVDLEARTSYQPICSVP